jgi:hypothetical protein
MRTIQTINLTQFAASISQRKAGVFDVNNEDFSIIKSGYPKNSVVEYFIKSESSVI